MSITFSSSENNYWCFFFIIIATRRKRRTQRDSETRERNEEKRIFCDRKTDELRTHRRFYHPRPFRRRLRNDLRDHLYILLHHRSTSRSRRRTHSARACLLFLLLLFAIQKRKERPTSSARKHNLVFYHPRSFRRRLRTDLRLGSFSIIARRREAEEEPIARARASSSFPLSLLLARFLRTKTRGEKKPKVRELR